MGYIPMGSFATEDNASEFVGYPFTFHVEWAGRLGDVAFLAGAAYDRLELNYRMSGIRTRAVDTLMGATLGLSSARSDGWQTRANALYYPSNELIAKSNTMSKVNEVTIEHGIVTKYTSAQGYGLRLSLVHDAEGSRFNRKERSWWGFALGYLTQTFHKRDMTVSTSSKTLDPTRNTHDGDVAFQLTALEVMLVIGIAM